MKKNIVGNYKISTLFLRIALGVFFLWFGIDKVLTPSNWLGWIPDSIFPVLPFEVAKFILLEGIIEIIVGVLLTIGLFTRVAAAVSSLQMMLIIIFIGFNEATIRDIGLLGGTISLLITGSPALSLDKLIERR